MEILRLRLAKVKTLVYTGKGINILSQSKASRNSLNNSSVSLYISQQVER